MPYRRVLWAALGINIAMFAVEIVANFMAGSVSLQADARDCLGDAAGTTLYHAIAASLPRAELMSTIGLVALAANLAVAGLTRGGGIIWLM